MRAASGHARSRTSRRKEFTLRTRDLNTIIITGQMNAEPEMQFTADGEPRTTFYLTCDGSCDTTTVEHVRLVAWGSPLAEQCNDLPQGTKLFVEGHLQRCTAEHPVEQARGTVEVRVRNYLVIDSGNAVTMRAPVPPTHTVHPPMVPLASTPLPRTHSPLPMMPTRPPGPRSSIASKTGKQ